MAEPLVIYEVVDNVAILRLNNPTRRHALSSEVLAALKDRLGSIMEDSTIKVVVLRSEGPVFSSGHDLRELVGSDEESYTHIFAECTEVMEAIRLLPQPVIAQVQGLATAAGCQLVATCDLAVASEDAGFCTPGVQIGLFCSTPAVALSRAVNPKQAMEMLLTGIPISAKTAMDWGLVNRVVPEGQLEDSVMQLARHIAKASAYTLAIGKQAFYRQLQVDRPAAYDMAQRTMVENLLAYDAQEGITAFLEKREPEWAN
ncbi:Enoyl-CoA hydratase domain-containing protein 3, mitochondrial [Geodia barretti]|uniref:Enoyl-CoA hydratase domain-containing protein 3, mitochondrial n=1 Tax=Geodia barretti TaxID=519541 RepID=A0AA35S5Q6_GEOBA|nr:Enoyl-CoA hydratase domain-containing protein 3, mitochondrial [Geodia barretti]